MSPTERPSASRSASRSRPSVRLVLLDANALFLPERDGTDLALETDRHAGPARLAVPTSVLRELDALVARGVPGARAARALAARYPEVAAAGRGDPAILRAAIARRAWVVTADAELSDRLRGAGLPVLAPRAGGRLAVLPPRILRGPRRATVMNRTKLRAPSRGRRRATR